MFTTTYVAFAAPLGTDSAAVCTAYGASSGPMRWLARFRVAAVLTIFEAGMPGVGMLVSGPVGNLIGGTAHYVAAALLIGLGALMLRPSDDDGHNAMNSWGALLAVGLAVSVDEIAIGVSLGLNGVPFWPLAATIGVWVGAATMAGLTLGARVPERFHTVASSIAAIALILLGVAIGLGVL
jgi:manganese efflux pump family protein